MGLFCCKEAFLFCGRPSYRKEDRIHLDEAQASHPTIFLLKNKVPTFYCKDFYLIKGGRPGSPRLRSAQASHPTLLQKKQSPYILV